MYQKKIKGEGPWAARAADVTVLKRVAKGSLTEEVIESSLEGYEEASHVVIYGNSVSGVGSAYAKALR